MTAKILLVNPPIYDFAAYDFWLKPYGLLTVAGYLRDKVEFSLFDFLDREHPFAAKQNKLQSDQWGRGRFYCERIPNPACLETIPRHFRRFGLPGTLFQNFIRQKAPFDFALIQTMMTYWYPGLTEVIQDIRSLSPDTKIILGGNYVTLCAGHAQKLGADFILQGVNLEPLWQYLDVAPDLNRPPLWEAYDKLNVGVLRLSDGCPLNCTYCSVPRLYGKFKPRPLERSVEELELLARRGIRNIAFYDDALLSNAEKVFVPFIEEVLKRHTKVNFHTPNALHARFVTGELADLMVRAGFKTFYLGFESASSQWHKRTGSKVSSDELAHAAEHLIAAGANPQNVTAYQLLGHPHTSIQEIEASMRFANSLGIRGMLADFSPIPGTPDGQKCRESVDMDEPLFHNKTAFPIIALGFDQVNHVKDLQRRLNRSLPT